MIEQALKILAEIEENIETCCAITMEPDDVLQLISAFGTRKGKSGGRFSDELVGNLLTWIETELSPGEIDNLNDILEDNEVDYKI